MRWGYFHSFNNYVDTFSMAYTVHSGCDIYAENCYYANGGNVICDWNQITFPGAYYETGSKFSNCQRTVRGQGTTSNPSYSVESTWRPNKHYDYKTLTADQAKSYCSAYAGCQTANTNWMYLRYAKSGIPSAGYTEAPSGPMTPTVTTVNFSEGAAFRIKNANSGLYLQVAGAAAENGTNVQQWGSDGTGVHDIWKLYSAGDDYYYLASCVGDGGTYVLDVSGKKSANGTNLDIYQYNGGTNQQFKVVDNGDDTYSILTRVTSDASAVEVADASKTAGANVQQWEMNGASCQNWVFEAVSDPGTVMETNCIYTFENANSGLVMDIEAGKMETGTNLQQWDSNGYDCQKWTLTAFNSGNYYWIRSVQDKNFALKAEGSANGANIDLAAYDSKDSAQLFRFTKNLDGTYSILTHASKDACYVEVDAASKTAGANVQQYAATNSACQKWNLLVSELIVEEPTTEETTEAPTTETTAAPTTEPTTTTEEPAETVIRGDVNGDGAVSILDIVALQRYLLAIDGFTQEQFEHADMNADNAVDVFDLALLKRAVLAK